MKTTYLNIRNGLKPKTKENMKKLCEKQGICYGELLNITFG